MGRETKTMNPVRFFILEMILLVLLFPALSSGQGPPDPLMEDTENPVIEDGMDSILLGGMMEEDEDLVKEGISGTFRFGGAGVILDNESANFREYGGIDDDAGYFLGDADLSYHRGSYFLNFLAEDLGLDNRSLLLETGKNENYKFTASFSQLPYQLSSNSKTPFNGVGGTSLTLPASFGKGNRASALTLTGLRDEDLEIDSRDTTAFGFSKLTGKNEFTLNYQRETKDGLKSLGGVVGTNAANARSIVLPEAIRQTSNEMTASFTRRDDDYLLKLEYFLSLFNNENESLTFEGPYAGNIAAFGPAVTAPNSGLISRAPDNTYHRVSLSGKWDLSRSARVSALAEYGLMAQDEDLFAFAIGSSKSLLPRQTADAKIHTLHFNLNGSANPFPGLGLNARYRHYQTINETPSTLFLAVVNDTGGQVASNNVRALSTQPYDYTQDRLNLDATYRLFKATHASLGYTAELMTRDRRDVEQSFENIFRGGVRSGYIPHTSVHLKASYAKRKADEYDAFEVFNARHTSSFVAGSSGFDTLPELRRFDVANRDRTKVGTNITWFPWDPITFGVNYNFQQDKYPDSPFGLKYTRTQNVTFDVNFSPDDSHSIFAYYTVSKMDVEQNGRAFTTGTQGDSTRDWRGDHDDLSHTAGVGGKTKFWNDRWTLKADYTFTQSVSNITFAAGSDAAVANPGEVPNLKTIRHAFETSGEYQVDKHWSLGLSYAYEIFEEDDFATDGFGAGAAIDTVPTTSVVLLSGTNRDYRAHITMLYASYRFGN